MRDPFFFLKAVILMDFVVVTADTPNMVIHSVMSAFLFRRTDTDD